MAKTPISLEQLENASEDVEALGLAVNGDDTTTVTTRLNRTYPTLAKAIKEIFERGGLPATPFSTKALMESSALVDGDYAMVTDDGDDNGLYVKKSSGWVKTAFNEFFDRKSQDYHLSFFRPNTVNIDFTNNKIDILNGVWIPTAHGRISVPSGTVALDVNRTKSSDKVVLVNRETSKIVIAEANSTYKTPKNHVVIGGYNEARLNTWGLEKVLINGEKQGAEKVVISSIPNYHIAFFREGALNIDFANGEVVLDGALWIPLKDRRIYIRDKTIQLDPNRDVSKGYYTMLLVNLANNELVVLEGTPDYVTPENHIIIGAFLEKYPAVWGLQGALINGKPVGNTGGATGGNTGSDSNNKRIAPYPFDADKYPSINVTDSFYTGEGDIVLNQITSTVVYGWYDALVAEYPEYVSKVNMGMDASGTIPIYEYIFKPMDLGLAAGKGADTPRVMVIALHNEQINFVYPYIGMREICKTWRNNEALEGMRWGAEIRVIPCLNPWGLDNDSRPNSNGIDLNRNFPHWFSVVTAPPTHVSGSAPLSESETQIAYNEMLNFKPHIMIDCHSYGGVKANGRAVWLEALGEADRIICNNVAKRTYLDMYKKHSDWMVDYTNWTRFEDVTPSVGTAGNARFYLGMLGGNLEIAWNMSNNSEAIKKGGNMAVNYTANVFLCFLQECLKYADKYGVDLKQVN